MNTEVQYELLLNGSIKTGTYHEIRDKTVSEIKGEVAKKFDIRDSINLRLICPKSNRAYGGELLDDWVISQEPWFKYLEKERMTLTIFVNIKDRKKLEYEYVPMLPPPCTFLGGTMLKKN